MPKWPSYIIQYQKIEIFSNHIIKHLTLDIARVLSLRIIPPISGAWRIVKFTHKETIFLAIRNLQAKACERNNKSRPTQCPKKMLPTKENSSHKENEALELAHAPHPPRTCPATPPTPGGENLRSLFLGKPRGCVQRGWVIWIIFMPAYWFTTWTDLDLRFRTIALDITLY